MLKLWPPTTYDELDLQKCVRALPFPSSVLLTRFRFDRPIDMLPLSPEICSNIAAFLSGSHKDLLSLCLTCKAFQREAEAKIYSVIVLDSPERALIACNTITCNERLALLVRTFWFSLNDRLFTANDINLGHDFWAVIRRTLIAVSNLEVLLLCDNAYTNTWIFDTPEISFRVREARLKFVWDANITKFLQSQSNLRTLLFNDPVDEVVEQLPPNSLSDLRMFDGTLSIGLQLLHTKIHHLQLVVDTEWWIENLPRFTALRRSLRSLSLLDVPEDASQRAVSIISQVLPDLRHLGIFPYPMMNVSVP